MGASGFRIADFQKQWIEQRCARDDDPARAEQREKPPHRPDSEHQIRRTMRRRQGVSGFRPGYTLPPLHGTSAPRTRLRGYTGQVLDTGFWIFIGASMACEVAGGLDAFDEALAFGSEGAEVALDLDAVPESVRLAEEGAKADGHGRGDGAFAEDDLIDGAGRHADGTGHGVLRDSEWLEILLQQDFTGGNGCFHGTSL